jgi:hypothetical protein
LREGLSLVVVVSVGGKEEPLFEPFEEGVEALINASRVLAKVSIEEVRLV